MLGPDGWAVSPWKPAASGGSGALDFDYREPLLVSQSESGYGFLDGGGSASADEPKLEGLASLSAQRPEPAHVCGSGILVDAANLGSVIKDGPIIRRPSGAHREGHAGI